MDNNEKACYQALREIYEVWAGSEAFIPQTAPEGYLIHLIEEMRDIAAEGMKNNPLDPNNQEG